ncbi:MAG TPA: aminomethyltransferase family protein, partial [Dongiaceae bacterium]
VLSPMLSPKGRLIGDFTVTRLGEERFILLGSGPMQRYHMRWFAQNLPGDGSIRVENISARYCGLHVAGPAARELLQQVATDDDVGGNAFPFLSAREMAIGTCPNAIVVRVSFTGELGYEIYVPAEYQRAVYDALTARGKALGLRLAGSRALLSLRVEKGFPSWGVDLSPDYSPFEPGLGRFVRLDKPDFVGKAFAERLSKQSPKERLATFSVEANGVDCFGGEAIYRNGELAGYVTSGTYGHHVRESLALGYVKQPYYEDGAAFEIELLGKRRPARLSQRARFDPEGTRMRA